MVCERTVFYWWLRGEKGCEALCNKGSRGVLGVLAVGCLYGGCMVAVVKLREGCGVAIGK